MNTIINHIGQFAELNDNKLLTPKILNNSFRVLDKWRVKNTDDFFYYLTALNLQYSFKDVIKKYKNEYWLSYQNRAQFIVQFLLINKHFKEVEYFYNKEIKCIYIRIYNVTFAFKDIVDERSLLAIKGAEENPLESAFPVDKVSIPLFLFAMNKMQNAVILI